MFAGQPLPELSTLESMALSRVIVYGKVISLSPNNRLGSGQAQHALKGHLASVPCSASEEVMKWTKRLPRDDLPLHFKLFFVGDKGLQKALAHNMNSHLRTRHTRLDSKVLHTHLRFYKAIEHPCLRTQEGVPTTKELEDFCSQMQEELKVSATVAGDRVSELLVKKAEGDVVTLCAMTRALCSLRGTCLMSWKRLCLRPKILP